LFLFGWLFLSGFIWVAFSGRLYLGGFFWAAFSERLYLGGFIWAALSGRLYLGGFIWAACHPWRVSRSPCFARHFARAQSTQKRWLTNLPCGCLRHFQNWLRHGHALIAHPVRQRFPRHPWRYNPWLHQF